jgi:hypothetical protein
MPLHKGRPRHSSFEIKSKSSGFSRSELWEKEKFDLDLEVGFMNKRLATDNEHTIWLGYGKRGMKYLAQFFNIVDLGNHNYKFTKLSQ